MSEIIKCDGPGCDQTCDRTPVVFVLGRGGWITQRRDGVRDAHFCSHRCAILHLGGNVDQPSEQYKTVELTARAFLDAWRRGEDETHAVDEAEDLEAALRAVCGDSGE